MSSMAKPEFEHVNNAEVALLHPAFEFVNCRAAKIGHNVCQLSLHGIESFIG